MSLTIPSVQISDKQYMTDSDGKMIELRLHDNKLYIMKVNADGSITEGGEMILDPLPVSALYGSSGEASNPSVEGNITLDTTADDFVANNQSEFIDAMNEETGGSTVVDGVTEGSAIVAFTVYFESSTDSAALDTVVAKLSDDTQISAIIQKAPSMGAMTATKTAGFTPSKGAKLAPGSILGISYENSILTIMSVGPFDKFQYNLGGSYIDMTGSSVDLTGTNEPFAITLRMVGVDSNIMSTKHVPELPIPSIVAHWPLSSDSIDILKGADLGLANEHSTAEGRDYWIRSASGWVEKEFNATEFFHNKFTLAMWMGNADHDDRYPIGNQEANYWRDGNFQLLAYDSSGAKKREIGFEHYYTSHSSYAGGAKMVYDQHGTGAVNWYDRLYIPLAEVQATWMHVAFQAYVDTDTNLEHIKVYVNGALAMQKSFASVGSTWTEGLSTIKFKFRGASNYSNAGEGIYFSDLKIWNDAIPQNIIQAAM